MDKLAERVERRILLVRGHRVMLDNDLAELYGVQTRVLNQAVRRNAERFPADFMFRLTREEIERMSQIVTSSGRLHALKYSKRVTVFTEQGVAMLSSVLHSRKAVMVNIAIMRAFVRLRELMATHRDLAEKLAVLESKYDAQFKTVFDAIRELMAPPRLPRRRIGFHPK